VNYNITHNILVACVKFLFIWWTVVEGNYCAESIISFLVNSCVSMEMKG
jgi:hypothetical protein